VREVEISGNNHDALKLVARFFRGDTLCINDVEAGTLASLGRLASVKHLYVESGDVTDQCLAEIVEQFPNLETFEFNGSAHGEAITPAGIAALVHLPALTTLRLDACKLEAAHIVEIARLRNLTRLSLGSNDLDAAGIAPLKRLPRLQLLDLWSKSLDDAEFKEIRGEWPVHHPYQPTTQIIPVVG
jgi:Leucine-rich repeat (LRR) protein